MLRLRAATMPEPTVLEFEHDLNGKITRVVGPPTAGQLLAPLLERIATASERLVVMGQNLAASQDQGNVALAVHVEALAKALGSNLVELRKQEAAREERVADLEAAYVADRRRAAEQQVEARLR